MLETLIIWVFLLLGASIFIASAWVFLLVIINFDDKFDDKNIDKHQ